MTENVAREHLIADAERQQHDRPSEQLAESRADLIGEKQKRLQGVIPFLLPLRTVAAIKATAHPPGGMRRPDRVPAEDRRGGSPRRGVSGLAAEEVVVGRRDRRLILAEEGGRRLAPCLLRLDDL